MDQQKKFIVGGVVAVSLVVAILFFSLRSSKPDQPVDHNILSDVEPKFELKDMKNMTNENEKILVAFQGYAKYLAPEFGDRVYLPLAPVSGVKLEESADKESQIVRFESEHAFVDMTFVMAPQAQIDLTTIAIETKDKDVKKSCQVQNVALKFHSNQHYECLKPKSYVCSRSEEDHEGKPVNKEVAFLTVSAMRAELTGSAIDHKNGKFTNVAAVCA